MSETISIPSFTRDVVTFRDSIQCVNLSLGLFRLYFSMFDQSLKSVVLDTSDGVGRIGSASEFMFMNFLGNFVAFKHHYTRNYIYMDRFSGDLIIPKSNRAFGQGIFDLDPWLNPVVWRKILQSKEGTKVLSQSVVDLSDSEDDRSNKILGGAKC